MQLKSLLNDQLVELLFQKSTQSNKTHYKHCEGNFTRMAMK